MTDHKTGTREEWLAARLELSCICIVEHYAPALSDEDQEIDPDRWCSHSAWGQECWQLVAQWVWNLRLELGHQLHPDPVRTTEFAPAIPLQSEQAATRPASPTASVPASGYTPPATATSWKAGRFSGSDFPLQPDGTLRCPAGQQLHPHERRRARRWQPARGLCGQHSQLPPLPAARAVSMEWPRHQEAAPGECAAASAPGGSRTVALARLEPQRAPAQMSAARATPMHRGEPVATRRREALHSGRDPVPCRAGALASLVGRAARSQCASSNSWSRHDQADRASQQPLPRSGWRRLNPALPDHRIPSSRTTSPLRAAPHGLFSWLFLIFCLFGSPAR